MKTIRHTHKPVVRVRCWSRKGYAAFASLGRQVTIGQLHLNVTERSLSKQKAAQTIPFNLFMTIEEMKDQVLGGIDITPSKQLGWLIQPIKRRYMQTQMRLPWPVARTNTTCDPSSMPSPDAARNTVNGVRKLPTTKPKRRYTTSSVKMNASDKHNTMKHKA